MIYEVVQHHDQQQADLAAAQDLAQLAAFFECFLFHGHTLPSTAVSF